MAKIITFLNFKGGVGKTANVVNIAACLAKHHKKRVLVIDLDSQCSTTYWLLRPNHFESVVEEAVHRTSYQIFDDTLNGSDYFNAEKAVLKGAPFTEEGFPRLPGLDLIPASFDLIGFDARISLKQFPTLAKRFQELLGNLIFTVPKYDYVFLDCGPNLSWLTRLALASSHHVVVPYNPDFLSFAGLRTLASHLIQLRNNFAEHHFNGGDCTIGALTINRTQQVGNVYQEANLRLKLLLEKLRQEKLVHPKARILSPGIRNCTALPASTDRHVPVLLHSPHSLSAQDYGVLTMDFINHFEAL